MDVYFVNACRDGNIELAKRLYIPDEHQQSGHINFCFNLSCIYGHIKMARWLLTIGATKDNLYHAFGCSCDYGQLEISKWLYTMIDDLHGKDDYAFRNFHCLRDIRTAKWLLSVTTFKNELIIEYSYKYTEPQLKIIFDYGYKPINEKLESQYNEYIERKHEIKYNCSAFLIPDLANLIYNYE